MCDQQRWCSTDYLSFSTNFLAKIYKFVVTDCTFRILHVQFLISTA